MQWGKDFFFALSPDWLIFILPYHLIGLQNQRRDRKLNMKIYLSKNQRVDRKSNKDPCLTMVGKIPYTASPSRV